MTRSDRHARAGGISSCCRRSQHKDIIDIRRQGPGPGIDAQTRTQTGTRDLYKRTDTRTQARAPPPSERRGSAGVGREGGTQLVLLAWHTPVYLAARAFPSQQAGHQAFWGRAECVRLGECAMAMASFWAPTPWGAPSEPQKMIKATHFSVPQGWCIAYAGQLHDSRLPWVTRVSGPSFSQVPVGKDSGRLEQAGNPTAPSPSPRKRRNGAFHGPHRY